MANISSLGSSVIDTVGDIIGGLGTNFSNSAELDAANIERIRVNNQIALANAATELDAKKKNRELMQTVTYAFLGLAFLALIFWAYPKLTK